MPLKTSAGSYWCNHCEDNAFSETCWRCHREATLIPATAGTAANVSGPVVRHRPVRHPARRMVSADARTGRFHQTMKRATLFSLALGLSTLASPARTKICDRDAVRAIIGEGANQCDAALAGIASAIHNRGNLRGVYGLNQPHCGHRQRRALGAGHARMDPGQNRRGRRRRLQIFRLSHGRALVPQTRLHRRENHRPNHLLQTMSHTSRLVAAEIQNANQLLNGVIEAVITTTPDASMPGFGLQVRRGKQLFNVWVDCDPEGNGPGHLNIVREQ